jgi:hypothetical protein
MKLTGKDICKYLKENGSVSRMHKTPAHQKNIDKLQIGKWQKIYKGN